MAFKLTYATMSNPPQEMHDKFDLALENLKQQLGQEYPYHQGGGCRRKYRAYSP